MSKTIIYIDMDDVLCDFTGAFERALKKNPQIAFPQSQYGFFRNLAPIAGAVEAVAVLNGLQEYEPYILTAPSLKNPLCYSEKREWVEKHLGFEMVRRLIISPDKSLLKGDYLIDDLLSGKGQEGFEGKHIHFGGQQFPGWKDVLRYFQR